MRTIVRGGIASLSVMALALGAYLILLFFPQPLFAHTYREGAYALHSTAPLGTEDVAAVLREATGRLEHSEFYTAGDRHTVFVTGSPALHAFFNGPNTRGMARNSEIGERIFIPRLEGDEIVHFDGRRERAAPILAHEATHTFIRREVGLFASLDLPFWLREGYGEYIAYRDPASLAERVGTLPPPSVTVVRTASGLVPRQYYAAGLMWEYLLDVRGLTAREVLRRRWDASRVLTEMEAWARRMP